MVEISTKVSNKNVLIHVIVGMIKKTLRKHPYNHHTNMYIHACKHISICTHKQYIHTNVCAHTQTHSRETMMMMIRLCLHKWCFNHMTLTISARGITPSVVCSMGLTPSIIVTCRHTCSDSYHEAKKQDKHDGHGGMEKKARDDERNKEER